jgi:hypothetical protein
MNVTCVKCGKQKGKGQANGWLIRPKTYTSKPGEKFVLCANCLSLDGSATADVIDNVPFRRLERAARQKG